MSYCWESNRGYKPLAKWVSTSNGTIPNEAVIGGFDISGECLYVGRSNHQCEVIPGKVVPSHGLCYVPQGGKEHGIPVYQVLVHSTDGEDFVWSEASNGDIPTGAIQGGVSASGERLYIGRVTHGLSMCIGKIQPSHRSCYIAFGGQEHAYSKYEVLCVRHIPLDH